MLKASGSCEPLVISGDVGLDTLRVAATVHALGLQGEVGLVRVHRSMDTAGLGSGHAQNLQQCYAVAAVLDLHLHLPPLLPADRQGARGAVGLQALLAAAPQDTTVLRSRSASCSATHTHTHKEYLTPHTLACVLRVLGHCMLRT